MISTEPLDVTWDELDRLVAMLAEKVGSDYDLVVAITRGGLVPAGILAYRLDLREILVVDEVWESGETMAAVLERTRAAGGRPMSAVIHYKPGRSRVALEPDFYAALAHGWVTYPYKVGD